MKFFEIGTILRDNPTFTFLEIEKWWSCCFGWRMSALHMYEAWSVWSAKRKGFFCVRRNFLIAYKVMIFWVLNPFKCLKRILVGIAIRCEKKKSGYYSQNLHKIAFRTMRWSAPSSYYCIKLRLQLYTIDV